MNPAAPPAAARIDGLRLIALFKFLKAALLILTTYGVHRLLDPDRLEQLRAWSVSLTDRVDQRLILQALGWIQGLDARKLQLVLGVSAGYTAVVLIEGTGLWMRWQWAKWVTVIATLSLIPFELRELLHRASGHRWTVVVTLAVNVAIAAYLLLLLRADRRRAGG